MVPAKTVPKPGQPASCSLCEGPEGGKSLEPPVRVVVPGLQGEGMLCDYLTVRFGVSFRERSFCKLLGKPRSTSLISPLSSEFYLKAGVTWSFYHFTLGIQNHRLGQGLKKWPTCRLPGRSTRPSSWRENINHLFMLTLSTSDPSSLVGGQHSCTLMRDLKTIQAVLKEAKNNNRTLTPEGLCMLRTKSS